MAFRGKPSWEQPPSGMKKSPVFSGLRSVDPRDLARERATHEAERKQQQEAPKTHILGIAQLKTYLESRGLRDACKNVVEGIVTCNPWAFEPTMLEELMLARSQHLDQETMNHLRDLVRSGSWMSYPRTSPEDALKEFQSVSDMEIRRWEDRIRHADPDTSHEFQTYLAEEEKDIDRVRDAVTQKKRGADAEAAVRIVEDMQLRAYTELKKLMHAHGGTLEEARQSASGKILAREIERLRPIRDRLYFQSAHPDWIARANR